MPRLERLTAAHLRAALRLFLDGLRARREAIDRLNVYPVPDADTGTNMALTVEAVVRELDALGEGADPRATADAVARGALRGARGISGGILSQFLGTLAEGFGREGSVGPADLADALAAAGRAAVRAVLRPAEGTILTVAREAAEAAARSAGAGGDPVAVLEAARAAAARALARTPELLPALRRAGVVDAGGTGLLVLFDALLSAADGRPLPASEPAAPARRPTEGWEREGGPRYEVACLLRAPDEAIPAFREAWGRVGTDAVVAGGGGRWRCHLHTDAPGEALEVAAGFGRAEDVRVTDLVLQVAEEWGLPEEPSEGPRTTAVVAVATGDGLRILFRSLGAEVVTGTTSLVPTPAELLEAAQGAGAEGVVLLAGDPETAAAARDAAARAAVPMGVVECRGPVEQLAALRAYDPDAPLEGNLGAMAAAAAAVRSGWVAPASGRWVAATPDGRAAEAATVEEAAATLLRALAADAPEIVTVVEGEGSTPGTTQRIVEALARARPGLGVQVLRGGQPFRTYVFGVE